MSIKKTLLKVGMSGVGRLFGGLFRKNEESDMHLPDWILGFSFALIAAAIVLGVGGVSSMNVKMLVFAPILLVGGLAAMLCYRNQKIFMTSDDTFEYRTMFGSVRAYRFEDIEKIVRNRDSMTMFVRGEKVHIESGAILSQPLVDRINAELSKQA